jgi:predicted RNase H-like nuclease (RuvC/YqgF family)
MLRRSVEKLDAQVPLNTFCVHINFHISNRKAKKISKSKCYDFKKQEKASAGSDAETKKLKAEVEELKGKLQLSAEEVAKLKSRCAAQSELLDQVLACLLFILSLRSTCTSRKDKRIVV